MAKAKASHAQKKLGGARTGDGTGPREDKVRAVTEVEERLAASAAVLLTEYRGMKVGELAELRASLAETGADYRVYKNTLASIAARQAGVDGLTALLEGPTAFTFVSGDPVVAAKRLTDFAKRVPTLVLKGGLLGERVLTAADAEALSKLESREIQLAKLAGMLVSPAQQLANLLAAGFNQLGSLLVQLKDKLPADGAPGAEAPAAEAAAPEAAAPADEPAAPEAAEAAAPGAPEAAETPDESAPTNEA